MGHYDDIRYQSSGKLQSVNKTEEQLELNLDNCDFIEVNLPELEGLVESGFGETYSEACESFQDKLHSMIRVLHSKENQLLEGVIVPRLIVE